MHWIRGASVGAALACMGHNVLVELATRTSTGRIPMRTIRKFVAEVVRRFNPEKVILFGSYAYGKPTCDSDVDLLVILPCEPPFHRKATEIRCACQDPVFPLDLLVRSREKLQERLELGDWFMREITDHGKVLHEASH